MLLLCSSSMIYKDTQSLCWPNVPNLRRTLFFQKFSLFPCYQSGDSFTSLCFIRDSLLALVSFLCLFHFNRHLEVVEFHPGHYSVYKGSLFLSAVCVLGWGPTPGLPSLPPPTPPQPDPFLEVLPGAAMPGAWKGCGTGLS